MFLPLFFSQAVVYNDLIFLSGALGVDKDTNQLVPGGAAAQAEKALENIGHILEDPLTAMFWKALFC